MAVRTISKAADQVITFHTALVPKFYVSYFYRFWNDMPEEEAIKCLREWEARRFKAT
jgi:predicted phosphoribosyltransferase